MLLIYHSLGYDFMSIYPALFFLLYEFELPRSYSHSLLHKDTRTFVEFAVLII